MLPNWFAKKEQESLLSVLRLSNLLAEFTDQRNQVQWLSLFLKGLKILIYDSYHKKNKGSNAYCSHEICKEKLLCMDTERRSEPYENASRHFLLGIAAQYCSVLDDVVALIRL
ncbi:hypothetical protein KFK09_012764 [Dendrobium nobile]|uniref:Uncharacterized protein n=1 Tax=Dendrobium nobile TaxID=94219 RepID=A0A8T3BLR8_DENNO|nr:hypothetical protein KFK09_012764 [Dendrobium nobile]